ncbi:hypothetical protein [Streptomyces sp. NBC_00847]|nr:hypothetical protein [Streptomyces sp. NBC_00847]
MPRTPVRLALSEVVRRMPAGGGSCDLAEGQECRAYLATLPQ